MRYVVDHDFHIHSTISPCCHDENQTPETILNYAKENKWVQIQAPVRMVQLRFLLQEKLVKDRF